MPVTTPGKSLEINVAILSCNGRAGRGRSFNQNPMTVRAACTTQNHFAIGRGCHAGIQNCQPVAAE